MIICLLNNKSRLSAGCQTSTGYVNHLNYERWGAHLRKYGIWSSDF